jgi:hypothetical protein
LERRKNIDNMEYWLAIKIYNVDNNKIIEFVIVLEAELEPTRRLGIYLVLVTILVEILDGS